MRCEIIDKGDDRIFCWVEKAYTHPRPIDKYAHGRAFLKDPQRGWREIAISIGDMFHKWDIGEAVSWDKDQAIPDEVKSLLALPSRRQTRGM